MSARFQGQIWHRVGGPNRLVMSPVSRLAPTDARAFFFSLKLFGVLTLESMFSSAYRVLTTNHGSTQSLGTWSD